MDQPQMVTIVGAGLVGTLLATMLTRRGYRVRVYEKRPDLRKTVIPAGRSINLALAERGLHALRSAGLMAEVEPLLIPMRGRLIHSVEGQCEYFPYGQRPHEVIYSVSRGALNQLMMNAMDADPESALFFEHELTDVDFAHRQMSFRLPGHSESQQVDYEMLIAADGGGSVLRRAIARKLGGQDDSELLDHQYKELNIPPAADGQFQMEREVLHIWPRGGFMLIALPNLDGSFTVTLFLPSTGPQSFERLRSPADVDQFFREFFPDAQQLIPDLGRDFFDNPTGELGTVRCWPWAVPPSTLLMGDAAHAIVPFHGQGMNCGFEDCTEFCRLLDANNENWTKTMRQFEMLRKPNADAIATMALENYIIMRDSVRDPKFQLKKEIGFELERLYPERFIPRYSMVMFHRIPYQVALERGKQQELILDELARDIDSVSQTDWNRAKEQVMSQLPELADAR